MALPGTGRLLWFNQRSGIVISSFSQLGRLCFFLQFAIIDPWERPHMSTLTPNPPDIEGVYAVVVCALGFAAVMVGHSNSVLSNSDHKC